MMKRERVRVRENKNIHKREINKNLIRSKFDAKIQTNPQHSNPIRSKFSKKKSKKKL